jgi:hypothetical protein
MQAKHFLILYNVRSIPIQLWYIAKIYYICQFLTSLAKNEQIEQLFTLQGYISSQWYHKLKNLHIGNNPYYYLFKKFLVSDWLTANCEIVISTQCLTKNGFFPFILAKWRQRVNMKKNLDAFAPYYYDDENHIDSLTPLIWRLTNCRFFLKQIK